jgi:hypothetical protein
LADRYRPQFREALNNSLFVTGDLVYKRRYQEILDIRDGKRPRPATRACIISMRARASASASIPTMSRVSCLKTRARK